MEPQKVWETSILHRAHTHHQLKKEKRSEKAVEESQNWILLEVVHPR